MVRQRSVFVASACLGGALLCAPLRCCGQTGSAADSNDVSLQKAPRAVSGNVTVTALALEGSRAMAPN